MLNDKSALHLKEKAKMLQTKSIRKFDLKTKQGKLFKALVIDRETLTEAQIAKRFGIKNPTATISVIRQRGYAVYANERVAGNNVKVTEYKHGEASRKMVALAYKAAALGITV
jgi:Holliday junction resolvasome RuvABC endonuclease subunit